MKLLLILGPPAVGKMTVGREIARRSSFRLFHNHHTIEPLVEVFGYGTSPFAILNAEFRRRVIEESARHGLDLIFTFVWNMEDSADAAQVERLVAPYAGPGGQIVVVELLADLETRLARNRGEERLAAKPTKRNVDWSEANLRAFESHQLNSGTRRSPADDFLSRHPHLRLDSTDLSASQSADLVLAWLDE